MTQDDVEESVVPQPSRARRLLRHNPAFWLGGGVVTLLILLALLAPIVAPHDPYFADTTNGLSSTGDPLGPTATYPLGTDRLGRDYLSRLLFGARTSLIVGIGANALASLIGVLIGATAAYTGNRSIRIRLWRLMLRCRFLPSCSRSRWWRCWVRVSCSSPSSLQP